MPAALLASIVVLVQAASVPAAPPADTLHVRPIARPPEADGRIDQRAWGAPQVRLATGQGVASIWLLRAADTVFVVAAIPDRTRSWADAIAAGFAVAGDGADAPAHDDFQWSFQRTLDSSVVYRGRSGRWEPPLNDPDWRLGAEHAGGGWEVGGADGSSGWTVVLRLDPAWLAGEAGRRPAMGFRIHDDDPNGWYSWPAVTTSAGATLLERTPALWVPVQ
ncbi:MAG: hypothetical protein ABI860_07260 [Gemmatimonadales bacterium]